MKFLALGSVVVVALFVGSVGCGGGAAGHDGGGGKSGDDGGARGGSSGSGGSTAGTGGAVGGTGGVGGRGGTTGSAGTTGTGGTTGSAGTTGTGGTTGSAGTTGAAGTTGSAGTTGRGGTTGAAGTTGSAGAGGTGGATAGTTGGGGNAGGGATCSGTAPCGGNVVGTWNFVSICLNAAALTDSFTGSSCSEAAISNVTGTESGSITFSATEYAAAASISLSYTLTLPVDCTNGVTCEYFGDQLYGSANVQSASCTGTTTCVCPIVTRPSLSSESGTYTTSGSTITVVPAGGAPDSASYCVENNRLHILSVETITDMGIMTMRTRSDQVAQRQQ